MKRPLLIALVLVAAAACAKPTELASNANGKGAITVAAAPPKTPPPELPPEVIAEREGEAMPADPAAPPVDGALAGPVTVLEYRPSVASEIGALPSVGDAAALAAAFATWKARADAEPGAFEAGQIQLGADPQEYRPTDAELVAAEAGERLAAALTGADEATRTSVTTILNGVSTYRSFTFRRVDVMGSGRYLYASPPRETQLPL